MYDGAQEGKTLSQLLRLQTSPVAVKLLSPGEGFPNKVHRPTKRLKHKITICQGISMARRFGWRLGLTSHDVCCVPALVAYGWGEKEPTIDEMMELMLAASYAENADAARRQIEAIARLGRGDYPGLILAPLERTTWEPDLVMVYCNPAQAMRLVHAATYYDGQPIDSSFGGRAASCSEGIIRTFQNDQCQVVIPGAGDRIFAMTGDDELAFTAPARLIDQIIEGLRMSGRQVGVRYPIPFYQGFEPRFPPVYERLFKEISES
jgi:uncharacterized protein (DUF169 family)